MNEWHATNAHYQAWRFYLERAIDNPSMRESFCHLAAIMQAAYEMALAQEKSDMKRPPHPFKGEHVFHKTGTEYIFVKIQGDSWIVLNERGKLEQINRSEFK